MNRLSRNLRLVTVCWLLTSFLALACSAQAGALTPSYSQSPAPAAAVAPATARATPDVSVAGARAPAVAPGMNPAAQVYRDNGASVVNVTSVAVQQTRLGVAEQPQGVGSGFILDRQGRIVTNNHVVEDADELTVTFADGATVPAKLLGRDPDNDLAVVQVDPNGQDSDGKAIGDRLKPVRLGNSDQITIGEDAIAIGSPLGLQQTVTAGIVSALRNPGEETARGELDLLGGAVQTDAPINPGNSGGPLFNAAGEVIGVNSAILSQSGGNIGIGFAIPSNVVKRVVPELMQSGRYRHPLIGVSALSLARIGQAARRQLGIPDNQKGLLVQESAAGAAAAGVRAGGRVVNLGGTPVRIGGDIITAIDGHPVTAAGELRGWVENNKHPGDTITLTVLRDGQRQDLVVTLSERPAERPSR